MNTNKINYHIILCIIILPFVFNWIGYHTFLSSPLCISITSVLLTISLLLTLQKGMHVNDVIATWTLIGFLWITATMYNSLGTVFTCYNIFMLAFLLNNTQFKKEQLRTIHFLVVVLLGIFIVTLDFTPFYGTYKVFQMNGEEININSFGVLILAFYYHFLLLLNNIFRKGMRYFLFLCVTPVAIYLIEISGCRSAYLALIVFLILYLNKNFKMERYQKVLFVMVVIAIVFPLVYLKFADKLVGLDFGGKSLLTRKYVWESAIRLIKQYPVFGSGTIYNMQMSADRLYTSSAHNVFLGLWKTVGFFPMIIFAFRLNKGKNMQVISKPNAIKKKMFLSCIFLCIFETLLNDSDTYLFFMLLLLTERDEQIFIVQKTENENERIYFE